MSRIDEPVEAGDAADVDVSRSARLSRELFDEVVAPLAARRHADGATPYFPAWRDDRPSYFVEAGRSTMRPGDFEFRGGGNAAGLIEALAAHWTADAEPVLAAAASRLTAIVEALRDEAVRADGTVDIFCYTLF